MIRASVAMRQSQNMRAANPSANAIPEYGSTDATPLMLIHDFTS
jgi:hypothetical protein